MCYTPLNGVFLYFRQLTEVIFWRDVCSERAQHYLQYGGYFETDLSLIWTYAGALEKQCNEKPVTKLLAVPIWRGQLTITSKLRLQLIFLSIEDSMEILSWSREFQTLLLVFAFSPVVFWRTVCSSSCHVNYSRDIAIDLLGVS